MRFGLRQLALCLCVFICILHVCGADLRTFSVPEADESYRDATNDTSVMIFKPLGFANGQYYVEFRLGTQKHPFRLSLDTGSSAMYVVSKTCELENGAPCRHADGVYGEPASKTVELVKFNKRFCGTKAPYIFEGKETCLMRYNYKHNVWAEGLLTRDYLQLSQFQAPVYFFQSTTVSNDFSSANTDGVWGLAYRDLTASGVIPTVFDNIVSHSRHEMANSFSLCFGDSGGALILGGVNKTLVQEDSMAYTPIQNETYYIVVLSGMFVSEKSIGMSPVKAIIDSGLPMIYVTDSILDEMKKSMFDRCSQGQQFSDIPGLCVKGVPLPVTDSIFNTAKWFFMTPDDVANYPDIQFEFPGTDGIPFKVNLPPTSYLKNQVVGGSPQYSFGFSTLSVLNNGTISDATIVLGNMFMRPLYTVFDRTNKRIGFANSTNCNFSLPPPTLLVDFKSIALFVAVGILLIISIVVFAFACYIRRKQYKNTEDVEYY
mmetsp:Transcript_18409/g.20465  ORF Transcript_18409/g.20465 Transcript_18409/m.20465 type:complete len:487 (-) Transcript_18409:60-1520(-)